MRTVRYMSESHASDPTRVEDTARHLHAELFVLVATHLLGAVSMRRTSRWRCLRKVRTVRRRGVGNKGCSAGGRAMIRAASAVHRAVMGAARAGYRPDRTAIELSWQLCRAGRASTDEEVARAAWGLARTARDAGLLAAGGALVWMYSSRAIPEPLFSVLPDVRPTECGVHGQWLERCLGAVARLEQGQLGERQ